MGSYPPSSGPAGDMPTVAEHEAIPSRYGSVFGRNLHPRMPLSFTPLLLGLKRTSV
jgi:hypothetical protein